MSSIGPKLEAERDAHYGPGGPANAKKGTVEVHRGDNYQFAYFLRKADPQAVVFKTRNYVMSNKSVQSEVCPPQKPHGKRKHSESPSETQGEPPARSTKRSRQGVSSAKQPGSSKRKGKDKVVEIVDDSEEEAEESPLSELEDGSGDGDQHAWAPLRKSGRKRTQASLYRDDSDDDDDLDGADRVEDEEMQAEEGGRSPRVKEEVTDPAVILLDSAAGGGSEPPSASGLDVGMDEDEEKAKPGLQLAFRGLSMRDRCLCVVVEPWPAFPASTATLSTNAAREVSVAPSARGRNIASGIAPSQLVSSSSLKRGQTPLFLPDFDERDRSATPGPVRFPSGFSSLNTMDEIQDPIDDNDGFGMLAFSQVLNKVSGDRSSGVDEDDEMEGNALYGDADEMRDIIQ